MSQFIFLTKADNEGEITYLAIDSEKIETLNVFETYDQYGQEVGHGNAGDYHIDNQYSDAKQDCIAAIQEKFGVEVNIDTHNVCVETIDNTEVDEWISDEIDPAVAGEFINEINTFISEWVEENSTYTTLKGFNYWDGNNWKTVVVEMEHGDCKSHQLVDDEDLIEELNKSIEEKEFLKKGHGMTCYRSGKWAIGVSQYQGDWESYQISEIEEEN